MAPSAVFVSHVFPLPDNCVGQALENVGARKRATEAVGRLSTVLELSRDAIIATDLDDRITYWSQGAEKTYGWTRQEAIGQHAPTFFQTENDVPLKEIYQASLEDGYWEGELRHTCKNGSRVIVFSQWTVQRDAYGRPSGWLKINSDITRWKQAESALDREREFSVRLIETSLRHGNPRIRSQALRGHPRRHDGETRSAHLRLQRRKGNERIECLIRN